jgi:DNA-binding IclR family transcriptional regulator
VQAWSQRSPYAEARYADRSGDGPDVARLRRALDRIRRNGFAVNKGLSGRGVVAVDRPLCGPDGSAVAGLSISMPSARYNPSQLRGVVAALGMAAGAVERELAAESAGE